MGPLHMHVLARLESAQRGFAFPLQRENTCLMVRLQPEMRLS